jgi:hypothetical protein
VSDHPGNATEIFEAEQLLLKFLCAHPAAATAQEIKSQLSSYKWRNPDHSVVFEALNRLNSARTATQLREQLPAQLTRLGFPDVNYEIYFEGKIPEERQIPALIETLRRAATSPPR